MGPPSTPQDSDMCPFPIRAADVDVRDTANEARHIDARQSYDRVCALCAPSC